MNTKPGYQWYIENYLPNYSSSEDVLKIDVLTRFLDGQELCESDWAWIEHPTVEDALQELYFLEMKLLRKAFGIEWSKFVGGLKNVRDRKS